MTIGKRFFTLIVIVLLPAVLFADSISYSSLNVRGSIPDMKVTDVKITILTSTTL